MNSIPLGKSFRFATIALWSLMVCFAYVDVLFAAAATAPLQYNAYARTMSKGAVIATTGTANLKLVGKKARFSKTMVANSSTRCESMCKQNSNCSAWTWKKPKVNPNDDVGVPGYCELKSGLQRPIQDTCCVSGYIKKAPDKCVSYGNTSVQQQQENLKKQCGFKSVYPRVTVARAPAFLWDTDYRVHYRWCSTGRNRELIVGVIQKRKDMLAKCIQKVIVPYLFRSTQSDATTALKNSRLRPGNILWESSSLPYGAVVRQDPGGGSKVPVGSKVDIWLAKAVQVRVPNVRGQLERQAHITLGNVGLKAVRAMQIESGRPDSEVLEQVPPAGALAKAGDVVRLVISRQMVNVPNLVGYRQAKAIEILRNNKLKLGLITKQNSGKENGTVLSQKPKANSRIRIGSAVKIYISKQVVKVPNLSGLSETEAIKRLKHAGLISGVITKRLVKHGNDKVLKQSPVAGKVVRTGSPVSMVIAKLTLIPVPDLKGLDVEKAKTLLEKTGLAPGAVSSEISEQKEGVVLRQNPAAGEKVKAGSPVHVTVADQILLVPDLGGHTREEAIDLLLQQGLQPGEIREQFSMQEENRVFHQFPEEGARVKPGAKVVFELAVHRTILLVAGAALLGLLAVGAAYSFRPRKHPVQSASGASAPVVRVRPHQDSGSSQMTSDGGKTTGHEVQFRPVSDQGEQHLSGYSDETTARGDKK